MARWSAGLLIGAVLFLAPLARAQQAMPPPAPPKVALVEEPPYDPAAHHGLSEGAWLRATRGTGRRSAGMMATGIGLLTLSASLIGAGSGIYVNDNGCSLPNGMLVPCGTGQTTGIALFSAGLIALGLGLPLMIYGAAEVPRAEAGRLVVPSLTVAVGAGRAALALRF
jgi:hypothetical protein